MQKIILASQSPRRAQLLEWAEIDFEVVISGSNESFPPGMTSEEIAIYISRNKALDVQKKTGNFLPILAADTIVVCKGSILGKPTDREDAIRILSFLSGTSHQVITGVTIITSNKEVNFADVTTVEFFELSNEAICYYVDKYKPYDKAGAYAIQEWIGVTGIKSITGDFYNVMGLPVSRVVQSIKAL